jgi:serine/threonine protein kinase
VKHIKLGASQNDSHGLDRRLRAVLNEIRIMHHAPLREHPNILSILGYGWRQSGQVPMPYIVVEYAIFGSLRQYLAESERSLRTKIIMAGDIAAGLNALHQCDIVHGDLKLENIVVLQSWDRPPGAIAKLCDFGHSIVLSADKKHRKYYGTALCVFSEFMLRR